MCGIGVFTYLMHNKYILSQSSTMPLFPVSYGYLRLTVNVLLKYALRVCYGWFADVLKVLGNSETLWNRNT